MWGWWKVFVLIAFRTSQRICYSFPSGNTACEATSKLSAKSVQFCPDKPKSGFPKRSLTLAAIVNMWISTVRIHLQTPIVMFYCEKKFCGQNIILNCLVSSSTGDHTTPAEHSAHGGRRGWVWLPDERHAVPRDHHHVAQGGQTHWRKCQNSLLSWRRVFILLLPVIQQHGNWPWKLWRFGCTVARKHWHQREDSWSTLSGARSSLSEWLCIYYWEVFDRNLNSSGPR